jgi:tetratricopeptide (TPR) repeat protein
MTGIGDFAQAEVLAERGQTYLAHGQYAEAWAAFNQAIEAQPNLAWAIAGRGQASHMLARYIEALADFSSAIELLPECASGFAMRGDVYRMLERYDEAWTDFNRALELDANCDMAIKGLDMLPRMTYAEAEQQAIGLGALEPQTLAERAAAALGGLERPFSESDRARERLSFWALALMRGEDPRNTVR